MKRLCQPHFRGIFRTCSRIVTACLAFSSVQLFAQIEEILVTAQKRAESIQDIAVSMKAIGGDEIAKSGSNNIWELSEQVANVDLYTYFGVARPDISIRGYNANGLFSALDQAPAGIYFDEVFVGSRSGSLNQLFDMERVEVLRGPQGTLYGRNTTAGAVNFISKRPTGETNFGGTATIGNYDQLDFEVHGGMALSDTVAVRIAGIKRDRDGTIKNVAGPDVNDVDLWAARGSLSWTPSEDMDWLLMVHGSDSSMHQQAWGAVDFGLPLIDGFFGEPYSTFVFPGDFHTINISDLPQEDVETFGVNLIGNIDFDTGLGEVTLTSVTGYLDTSYFSTEDTDGTNIDFARFEGVDEFEQISQEVRLSGTTVGVDWVSGFYYYEDDIEGGNAFHFAPAGSPGGFGDRPFSVFTQDSTNWAVFGDFRFALIDQFTINVGGRYTDESKDYTYNANPAVTPTPPVIDSASWDSFDYKIGLNWEPTDDVLIYASYSTGFKSGGFNGGQAGNGAGAVNPADFVAFDPEEIESYELGIKSVWYGGRFVFNAAVFYNDITGLQQTNAVLDDTGTLGFPITNVGQADVIGAEIEMIFQPIDALYASLNIGILDSEIADGVTTRDSFGGFFDLSGNELPLSPDNVSGLVEYVIPLEGTGSSLRPRIEFKHTGTHALVIVGDNTGEKQESYTLLNASLEWLSSSEQFSIKVWGKNITNKEYISRTIGFLAPNGIFPAIRGEPATYGVTLGVNF